MINLKNLLPPFLCVFLFSNCTIEKTPVSGVRNFHGSIGLVDIYGVDIEPGLMHYADLDIVFIDSLDNEFPVYINNNGKFNSPEMKIGTKTISVSKPGFVGVEISEIFNGIGTDTLPQIVLSEEAPFKFTNVGFSFVEPSLSFVTYDYETDEDYRIKELFAFHLTKNVDINNQVDLTCGDEWIMVNEQPIQITSEITASIPNPSSIESGDTIFIVAYPVTAGFPDFYTNQISDFAQAGFNIDNMKFHLHNKSEIVYHIIP